MEALGQGVHMAMNAPKREWGEDWDWAEWEGTDPVEVGGIVQIFESSNATMLNKSFKADLASYTGNAHSLGLALDGVDTNQLLRVKRSGISLIRVDETTFLSSTPQWGDRVGEHKDSMVGEYNPIGPFTLLTKYIDTIGESSSSSSSSSSADPENVLWWARISQQRGDMISVRKEDDSVFGAFHTIIWATDYTLAYHKFGVTNLSYGAPYSGTTTTTVQMPIHLAVSYNTDDWYITKTYRCDETVAVQYDEDTGEVILGYWGA